MNEAELSRELHAAIDGVNARADLAEVEQRSGHLRRRRRVVGGVLAAMLVAGAGGVGFGIGRSVSEDNVEIAAGEPTSTASDDADSSGATEAETTTSAAPSAADEPAEVAPSPPAHAVPVPAEPRGSRTFNVDGDYGSSVAPDVQQPLEVFYERVLPDAVRVRFQRGVPFPIEYAADGWQPAAYCWANREGRVTFDGPDMVDVQWYGWYTELFGDVHVDRMDVGQSDGHPLRVLQVQARESVTEVAVNWDDGLTDRTPVVNGVAALVVSGTGAWERDFTLEVVAADGVRTLTAADLDEWSNPEFVAACQEPPPGLPEPGEQPADPEAEAAAIRQRFDDLWNRDIPREAKTDLLDDWTGVAEAIEAVYTGTYAEAAATAEHRIDEIVFATPTEAWFFYTVISDISTFPNRYGRASLVDGQWQFPRALICQDLSLGGAGCEPWTDGIFPPSYYERYGEQNCYESEDGAICEAAAVEVDESQPPATVLPEG